MMVMAVVVGSLLLTALILVPLFALLDGGWPWWELKTVNSFIEDYNKSKQPVNFALATNPDGSIGRTVYPDIVKASCRTGGLGYDTHCSIVWGEYQWKSYLDPTTGNAYYKWDGTLPPQVKHPDYFVKQIHNFLRDNR